MNDATSTAFADASRFFVDAVAAVPATAWSRPGLGSWTVRELVAHTNRAHTTIEDYLLHPRPPEPPGSAYFAPEAIAERGREAERALGDDPAAAVAAASVRVVALVASTASDAPLGSPAGTMTLAEYLPSRVAEFVIHGLDLTRAVDLELTPSDGALRAALAFVAGRAAGTAPTEVLLALTGRGVLPEGYSVF